MSLEALPTPIGALSSPVRRKQFKRTQYAVVLVLAPINGTFEKKSLVVPFSPDVLKLGRQTNVKTVAGPENGFFDSRVLSRQHAELWADKDSGKVWIKDCKSSNGTYLNRQRLSGENTESEPFELKKNDLIDLGIDIACDDKSSLVYKKISAKVDRVSMMPLHVSDPSSSPSVSPSSASSSASSASSSLSSASSPTSASSAASSQAAAITSPLERTPSRSPSIATLKPDDDYTTSVFGAPGTSLENMALLNARNTVSGMMVKSDIASSVAFELATKRLVSEIRAAKSDTAKLASVRDMLDEMRNYQATEPPHVLALRDEVARLKHENTTLQTSLAELRARMAPPTRARLPRKSRDKLFRPSDFNNLVLLVSTTLLMVITGVCIMLFFNPPSRNI